MKTYPYILFAGLIILMSTLMFNCEPKEKGNKNDDFNRETMLINWADNIIIPAYESFKNEVDALKKASDDFETTPNTTSFNTLRQEWEDAYVSWQKVSLFSTGPSEDEFLRNFLNTYPTSKTDIDTHIASSNYNLENASTFDKQGFPALDYLLFGLANTNSAILEFYTTGNDKQKYLNYLTDVVDRIQSLTEKVVNSWKTEYRDTFVDNKGTTALSATNLFVNDYIQYYERNFRDGKIGIPAGIRSNNILQPTRTEAFYKKDISKKLFNTALDAFQNFFKGKFFNRNSFGESLESYLNYLDSMKNNAHIATLINNQFDAIRTTAKELDTNFSKQISTDNTTMISLFDQIQPSIVLLKSDMVTALNIPIDFTDSDGD